MGVADGYDLSALLAGVTHRHEGIHGLAGLRESHNQGLLVHDGVAVAELMSELDLGGDTAPVLDSVARNLTRVRCGTAGHHDDLIDRAQHGIINIKLVQNEVTFFIHASHEGLLNGGGLLVDFLLHKRVVAALFRRCGVPFNVERFTFGGVAVKVNNRVVGAGDGDNLILPHLHGFFGVIDKRRNVRAQEVLVLPQADHQRGVTAGGHHLVGVVCVHRKDCERTLHTV